MPSRLTQYAIRFTFFPYPCLPLIALAWLARLRGLGLHSLWLDEALEFLRASSNLEGVLHSRLADLDPPLYSLIMHFWIRLGPNDFLVRFPSAAFGVLATVLTIAWLRRHGPSGFALLGGLIFALAPVQVHYAQELNQYSLVGLLAVLTLLAFDRVLEQGRWRDWGVFALIGALDLFTYYGLVWLLAALVGYSGVLCFRRRDWWMRFLACQLVFASAALALLPFSLEGHILRGLAAWTGQYAQLERGDVLQQFVAALHGHLILFSVFPFSDPPTVLVAAVYALLVLGAFAMMRGEARQGLLLLAVLIAGPALAFVASGFGLYPFQGRHILFAAPALYALLAAGIWALRRFRPLYVATVASAAATLIAFWTIPAGPPNPWLEVTTREELRPVLAQVRAQFQSGDAVYVYYAAHAAYTYYQEAGLTPPAQAFLENGWPTGRLAAQFGNIRLTARGQRRLWLIFAHLSDGEDSALAEALWLDPPRWVPVERIEAKNAVAYLFVRNPLGLSHADPDSCSIELAW